MFKSKKGQFGYLKKQAVRQGIFTLAMLFVSAAVFIAGWMISGSPKNLVTIASVLGMLPVSKSLVSFIMYIRAEKYSASMEIYESILNAQMDDSNGIVLFDSYMTSYDKVFPVECILIKNGCLCGFMEENKKSTVNDAKSYIEEYMSKNNISGINVKIFNNKDKFINRTNELFKQETDYNEAELLLMQLIKNLTL